MRMRLYCTISLVVIACSWLPWVQITNKNNYIIFLVVFFAGEHFYVYIVIKSP